MMAFMLTYRPIVRTTRSPHGLLRHVVRVSSRPTTAPATSSSPLVHRYLHSSPAQRQATTNSDNFFQTTSPSSPSQPPPPPSSSSSPSPIQAASPIQFDKIQYARPVPSTPSYFARQPQFCDSLVRISRLAQSYVHLPKLRSADAPRVAWKTLEDYRQDHGEPVRATQYALALRIAKSLHLLHPTIVPPEVTEALADFKKDIDPFKNTPNQIVPDAHGRAIGVGRRKEAIARAWVVEGTGDVLINGKPVTNAFGRLHDRESALWALYVANRLDKYNVWALVEGGGTTGQAEALTLAIAKGLVAHEPDLKPILRKAGCITRDRRIVERKKHGHVKARKMPAWVKR